MQSKSASKIKRASDKFIKQHQPSLQRAQMYQQVGQYLEAEAIFRDLLILYPSEPVLLTRIGTLSVRRGNLDEGLKLLTKSLSILRNQPIAWSMRGIALMRLDRLTDSLESLNHAIALDPRNPISYGNRGRVRRALGLTQDALRDYEKSIRLQPNIPETHYNRGNTLRDLRNYKKALDSYNNALTLAPTYPEPHVAIALLKLLLGEYKSGWLDYEWRWKLASMGKKRFPATHWLGNQPICGKTLLLFGEQGFGDSIQFCRYALDLLALGANIILQVPDELVILLSSLDKNIQVIGWGHVTPHYDLHCPLMSLPLAMKTDAMSIPQHIPYLEAPPDKVSAWADKLVATTNYRVGLVWSGGDRPGVFEHQFVNQRRNIDLSALSPFNIPGIQFYSLQKGEKAVCCLDEMKLQRWLGPDIIDLTNDIKDFSDTAALISHMDLVISVDTAVAHLAGAMGKTVWIMNRYDSCWRWSLDRTDSPWYPSATLFRQPEPGDWSSVVAEVARRLENISVMREAQGV